jgi:predicted phosphoribosyltransferase
VVIAAEVAGHLHAPLDVSIPRKVGHPFNPEYAIAAVTENGGMAANQEEITEVDPAWFEEEVTKQRQEAKRRRELYLKGRPPVSVKGKTAIIVDDGIATGLTMKAAIHDVQQRKPAKIIVAVPVAPKETVEALKKEVDEVICLIVPEIFLGAIGAYYEDFPQVPDDEVISLMRRTEV